MPSIRQRIKQIVLLSLTPILVLQGVLFAFSPSASAAVKVSGEGITNQIVLLNYALMEYTCFASDQDGDWVTHTGAEKIAGGNYWNNSASSPSANSKNVYSYNNTVRGALKGIADGAGNTDCDEHSNELTKAFLQAFQLEAVDFFCAIGYQRTGTSSDCVEGVGDFGKYNVSGSNRGEGFISALKTKTGLDLKNISPELAYNYLYDTFYSSCKLNKVYDTISQITTDTKSDKVVSASVILDNIGVPSTKYFFVEDGKASKHKYIELWGKSESLNGPVADFSCEKIASRVSEQASVYASFLRDQARPDCEKKYTGINAQIEACIDGAVSGGSSTVCKAYSAQYTITKNPDGGTTRTLAATAEQLSAACTYGGSIQGKTPNTQVLPQDTQNTAADCSSTITGIGWIVCPIIEKIGSVTDWMFGQIESILLLNPLENSSTSGPYIIWQSMRNIANILLVIAFLIIIFSQVTNIGVTNYGIKKLLPKIIVVAIAINLSFFIMMLAIDAVNIIGKGLYDLINGQANAALGFPAGDIKINLWTTLITGLMSEAAGITVLGAVITGGETIALMAIAPIVGALIAVFAAFITLYLRNALIIILVVLSPVAFTAYLLPNTSRLFDSWRKTLTNLLILYPTAAVLFAGSKLAGAIIITANDSNTDSTLNVIFGLFVMAAPLFMLPWLARRGNSMLAKVNDSIKNVANKQITDRVKKKADERLDTIRAEQAAGMRNILGGRGWGKSGFGSSMDSRFAKNQQLASDYAKLEQSKARKKGETKEAWESRVKGINDEQSKLKKQMRMTSGQRKANRQLAREERVAAAKTMAKANYTIAGLENTEAAVEGNNAVTRTVSRARATLDNRSMQNARRFQNQSELATARLQAAEAQKKSETAARINVPGSEEAGLFAIRKNAEAKTGLSEAKAEATYLRSVNQDTAGRFQTMVDTKMAKQAVDVYNKEQEGAFQVRLAGNSAEAKELRNRATDANVKIERGQAEITAAEKERRATTASLRNDLNRTSDAKDRTQKFENMEGARIEQRAVDDTAVLQTRAEAEQYKSSQERAQAQAKQIRDEISTDAGRANLRKQLEKRKTAGVRQRQEQERGALAARLFASRGIANNDMSAIADSPELLAFDRQAQQELDSLIANDTEIQAFDRLASTGSVIQGENSAKRGADTASRFATEQQSLEYAQAVTENDGDNDLARAAAGATGSVQRVVASASQEVDEAATKAKQAARIRLDDQVDLSGAAIRERALDPTGDIPDRKAAIEKVVETGDITGIKQLLEESNTWAGDEGDALRATLGSALNKNKPGFVSQGTLANLRAKQKIDVSKQVIQAVKAGQYSEEFLATCDDSDLVQVYSSLNEALQDPEKRADAELSLSILQTNAKKVRENPLYAGKIQKTRDSIDLFAGGPKEDDENGKTLDDLQEAHQKKVGLAQRVLGRNNQGQLIDGDGNVIPE